MSLACWRCRQLTADRLGLLVLAAVLAACQAPADPQSPEPLPTPFPEITTTPSFSQWVIERVVQFRESAQSALPVGFGIEIWPYETARQSTAEGRFGLLVSSAEPPPGWFVTPLGWEGIAFAVHPQNRVRDLDRGQLASIFSGQARNWEQLGGSSLDIVPVIPLQGDELRDYLGSALMQGRPFTPAALLGPTPELALTMVAERPGAIAILPLTAVSEAARPLLVEGVAPRHATVASGEYPFRVELLAAAPAEPAGQIRQWLVWLQSGE